MMLFIDVKQLFYNCVINRQICDREPIWYVSFFSIIAIALMLYSFVQEMDTVCLLNSITGPALELLICQYMTLESVHVTKDMRLNPWRSE